MAIPPAWPTPPAPQQLSYASASPDRNYLRLVATQQRNVMLCILGNLLLVMLQFVVAQPIVPILALVSLGVAIFAVVCVVRLATRIYSTGVAVLLGILTILPLIGLIALVIINSKATSILKSHGLRVGLLGADPRAISRL